MKKTLSLVLVAVMLCTLVLSLAACSAYGGIEKRFVDAGWKVVNTADEEGNQLLDFTADLEEDGEVSCTVHILKKSIGTYAIILEFGADADAAAKLDEIMTDEDKKNFMEVDEKSAYLNGNCVLVPFTLNIFDLTDTVNEMTDLFQG